jgi:hypothetical protein
MGLLALLLPAAAVEPPWGGGGITADSSSSSSSSGAIITPVLPLPLLLLGLRGLLGVDDDEGQQPGGAVEGGGEHAGVAAARLQIYMCVCVCMCVWEGEKASAMQCNGGVRPSKGLSPSTRCPSIPFLPAPKRPPPARPRPTATTTRTALLLLPPLAPGTTTRGGAAPRSRGAPGCTGRCRVARGLRLGGAGIGPVGVDLWWLLVVVGVHQRGDIVRSMYMFNIGVVIIRGIYIWCVCICSI